MPPSARVPAPAQQQAVAPLAAEDEEPAPLQGSSDSLTSSTPSARGEVRYTLPLADVPMPHLIAHATPAMPQVRADNRRR